MGYPKISPDISWISRADYHISYTTTPYSHAFLLDELNVWHNDRRRHT